MLPEYGGAINAEPAEDAPESLGIPDSIQKTLPLSTMPRPTRGSSRKLTGYSCFVSARCEEERRKAGAVSREQMSAIR
jgi:hypothetical protein